MRPGSVIVDLAADTGGNCELTMPGEVVVREGVTLVGLDEPAELDAVPRVDALLPQRRSAAPAPRPGRRAELDWSDEITAGACVTGKKEVPRMSHNTLLVFEVTILVLAIFLGFEVISKVPAMLHTPLMSGTNAIHGIVIVGAMLVLGLRDKGAHLGDRLGRCRARVGERRRWLRRHRPHARDVQEARAAEEATRDVVGYNSRTCSTWSRS